VIVTVTATTLAMAMRHRALEQRLGLESQQAPERQAAERRQAAEPWRAPEQRRAAAQWPALLALERHLAGPVRMFPAEA